MGEAIGQSLPAAVAIALSPFPIIGVVLLLVTPRGRLNGLSFLIGWFVGLAVVGLIAFFIADRVGDSSGTTPTWISVVELVGGLLLLFLALRQWQGRPRRDDDPPMPGWMSALDSTTPLKAVGLGLLLSAVNPKALLLALAGAAEIAATGISSKDKTIAYIVFALVASIGVVAPVVISFVMGDRAVDVLDGLKTWMARNNAVIMAVILVIIGAKLIGDAIAGFSG